MANQKLWAVKDNASGNLNAGISASITAIPLQSGQGANFPTTLNGTATSSGTSTTLNSTGIQAEGVEVGDAIYNRADRSWAIVTAVAANSVTTTPLQGGSDNTWDNADTWVVDPFIVTIVQYNTTNDPDTGVNKREKVLIIERSGDNLTAETSIGRGYDGSSGQTFDNNDNVYLFTKAADIQGLQSGIADLYTRIVEAENTLSEDALLKDGSIPLNNNTAFKARNNANNANIDLFKLLTTDILEFQTLPRNPSSRSISSNYDLVDKKYFDDNSETANMTRNNQTTAGETITVSGNPLAGYISDGTNGRTAGSVYQADANDTTNGANKFYGFVTSTVSSGNTADVKQGVISGFTGLTSGVYYYLSDTPGVVSATPSTTTRVCVGRAISTTEIDTDDRERPCSKIGQGTRSSASSTGSESVSTGFKPTKITIRVTTTASSGSGDSFSDGSSDGTTNICAYLQPSSSSGRANNVDTANCINVTDGTNGWTGTITITASGFDIAWTKVASGVNVAYAYEAEGFNT